mmetsp:Transcript_27465/g.27690  ORF Transcript_27465/g.27690 Transcript_27465/m.27690 type:complete len:257 (+) Transcript_27465:113-883(+)
MNTFFLRTAFIAVLLSICSIAIESVSPIEELLGETLYKWNSTTEVIQDSTSELLKGKKVIGIYVSASWCGPCQKFTPELASFYKAMNKKKKKFEIVWLSQDRSQEEFQQYYTKMPWLAVPVENVQEALKKIANPKYGLKGIPHLIIMDAEDGSIITTDGRTLVSKDKYGLEFPWRKRNILSLIPKPLRRMLARQLNSLKERLQHFVKGILSSLTPGSIFSFVKLKVIPTVVYLVKACYRAIMSLRKSNKTTAPAES